MRLVCYAFKTEWMIHIQFKTKQNQLRTVQTFKAAFTDMRFFACVWGAANDCFCVNAAWRGQKRACSVNGKIKPTSNCEFFSGMRETQAEKKPIGKSTSMETKREKKNICDVRTTILKSLIVYKNEKHEIHCVCKIAAKSLTDFKMSKFITFFLANGYPDWPPRDILRYFSVQWIFFDCLSFVVAALAARPCPRFSIW